MEDFAKVERNVEVSGEVVAAPKCGDQRVTE